MDRKSKPFWKRMIRKKRTWVLLGLVLIISFYFAFRPNPNLKNIVTDTAKLTDLKETILATGQVTSKTDLDLSFNSSGVVRSLKVAVGDKVKAGQILATLDQGSVLATLTEARGALASAQAKLKKTLDGASNEDIALAQVSLDQTKLSQATLVLNAYHNLLNSTPETTPADQNVVNYTPPTISGVYNGDSQGVININVLNNSGNPSFTASGLIVSGSGSVSNTTPQPIGTSGLYIFFPTSYSSSINSWVINLPNKKATNYLTNYNAYQAALSQSNLAIAQAQAELDLKKAKASQSDVDLAKADIVSAEGQVQAAEAKYEDTIIRAPADGTITSLDIKFGELAQALKEVMVLQDVSNVYLEANINEANIANVTLGMPVDVTFDAFGTDKVFHGTVTKIDPSSTIISGVVNYKVTTSVEQFKDIKPGMTANMTINVKSKDNIIAIPARAIQTDKSGLKTVKLITDTKNKTYKDVKISTGLEGDGGMVEVTSGLKEGDEFVVLIKNS